MLLHLLATGFQAALFLPRFRFLTAAGFFFGALAVSMSGLAYAMKSLPTGTSYAIWVGVGAVLTVLYSVAVDGEPLSALKALFLLGIVGCVIGLKVVA